MDNEQNKPIEELCRKLRKDHALRLQAQWVPSDPQAAVLQERGRKSRVSSVLLRASHAPEESGHTLLRAAWERPNTDPTQLLRATLANGDEGAGEGAIDP